MQSPIPTNQHPTANSLEELKFLENPCVVPKPIRDWFSISTNDRLTEKQASRFLGTSRRRTTRLLSQLCGKGILTRVRKGLYEPRVLYQQEWELSPSEDLDRWVVEDLIAPLEEHLQADAYGIIEHSVGEMMNNAWDHSEGTEILLHLSVNAIATQVFISDNGIGVFIKLRDHLGLSEPRDLIVELAKGKMTTAPTHHSGEGVFFTSRMVDSFVLLDPEYSMLTENGAKNWLIMVDKKPPTKKGTLVAFTCAHDVERSAESVMAQYQDEDGAFMKTVIPVKVGPRPKSRSEARRFLARCRSFKVVTLDFQGVDSVGEKFADELLVSWPKRSPNVELNYVNASPAVASVLESVISAAH